MATTGPKLAIPFTVGAGAVVGQGDQPELWCLYSTDDASSVVNPNWLDATAKVRLFGTSRGRESELAEVDAGSASITLDNRTRTFDSAFNSLIRPMNRWWLREQFSGETQDLFKGYAESYDLTWPGWGGSDAECVVSCADEFKVLTLDALPVTDPPRESYAEVVEFDEPSGYWQMNDDVVTTRISVARIGKNLLAADALGRVEGAIAGDPGGPTGTTAIQLPAGQTLASETVEKGESGEVLGQSDFAIELWFSLPGSPAATRSIVTGPDAVNGHTYRILLTTTGAIQLEVTNSSDVTVTATSAPLTPETVTGEHIWNHIVGERTGTGGNIKLYINGTLAASTASSGSFADDPGTGAHFLLGDGTGEVQFNLDEVATYRHGLTASRVAAHHTAGTARGFRAQLPGTRLTAILEASTSDAPRSIQVGTNTMRAAFMHGQPSLEELRQAVKAESVDALLFIARDGTITFLADGHRSSSPYNTVQATFDDDGTDLPYLDVDIDYSEAFLANEWNVTRAGGTVQTAADATSITRYFKRARSLTDLSITSDADALAVATAMLAKYKDPLTRIISLTLSTADPAVAAAAFARDLGDRVRVFRTPPGGGARIDQTLFIQKIQIEGRDDRRPWSIRWSVSPL